MAFQTDDHQPNVTTRSIVACAAIFLVINSMLIRKAWILSDISVVCLLGILCAQSSLATLWSIRSQIFFPLRFAVAIVAAVGCWVLFSYTVDISVRSAGSAAFAIMFATQSCLIVLGCSVAQNLFLQSRRTGSQKRSAISFDLQSLLMSTVVAAGLFALASYGHAHWNWDVHTGFYRFYATSVLLGTTNAVVAVCWITTFDRESQRPFVVRLSISTAAVAAAFAMVAACAKVFDLALFPYEVAIFLITHALLVIAVLLACFGLQKSSNPPEPSLQAAFIVPETIPRSIEK